MVDGFWEKESQFLEGVASSRLPTLQQMAPYPYEYMIRTNWALWGIFKRDMNLGVA